MKYGLDVHPDFQPFMDFGKLRDDPNWNMKFCIVKCSEGYGWKARRYSDYIKRIEEAGLITGSYHYFYALDGDTKWEAERQADYYISLAGETNLPLCVDLEDKNAITKQNVDPQVVLDGALWCLDRIEKVTGITPMLYTGDWYLDLLPRHPQLLHYPLWIASYQYPDTVNPNFAPWMPNQWVDAGKDWVIHQFSTKYANPEVARRGYEWPAGSGDWYDQGTYVNCDINKTTEEKLNELLGEPSPTPPSEKDYNDGYEDGVAAVSGAVQDTLDEYR